MKKNELLKIAGQEFVVNTHATAVLNEYLKNIKKKYRFQPTIRKSFEEALRDVLISYQTSRSNIITKPKAISAVTIVGNTYEASGPIGTAVQKSSSLANSVLKQCKKLARNQKIRNGIYALIACASLMCAIVLTISAWNTSQHSNKEEKPTGTYTIETTIGNVRSNHWANYPDFPDYPSGIEQTVAGSITCFLIAIFFITLVRKYRHQPVILALVVMAGASWLFLAYSNQQNRENHMDILRSTVTPAIDTVRTTKDLDYLTACGTEIQTVMGEQSGRLFYAFQDEGFKLQTELETEKPYIDPTREQICTTYDQLRQTHPDNEIVLQLFIRDVHGTIRPLDYEETYTTENGLQDRYPGRYGFFVKAGM